MHIDHKKVLSFLYGLELGVAVLRPNYIYGSDSEESTDPEYAPGRIRYINVKRTRALYCDMIVGANLNFCEFWSLEFQIKYEPFGIYNRAKPENSIMTDHIVKYLIGSSIYF